MEIFGDYELVAPLAKGGMAELFRARHTGTKADVVVKRLLPEMETREDVVELFLTEVDVGRLLRHENIVAVLDAGEVQGRYFIAMEYIDGLDVDHLIVDAWKRRELMSRRVALRIAIDALRGLHAAHELRSPRGTRFGLVHRDVSPDNIFVTRTGLAKVADFGIAKLASLEGTTRERLIKGKLTYMAPEQVRGTTLDARADAFSCGLVLYEMLSGVRPFAAQEGETEVDTLMRVRAGKVRPLGKVTNDVPAPIVEVADKALRTWRFLRHRSCGAFADALERAAGDAGLLGTRENVAAYVEAVRGRR